VSSTVNANVAVIKKISAVVPRDAHIKNRSQLLKAHLFAYPALIINTVNKNPNI
jgi:hypothetical protein